MTKPLTPEVRERVLGYAREGVGAPLRDGLSPPVEPASSLNGFATSIPSAWSFCWTDVGSIEERALALVMSMAAVKCKNMYPKGVFGHEARAHYDEARHIAAQVGRNPKGRDPQGLGAEHEHAVAESDAPPYFNHLNTALSSSMHGDD